MIMSEPDAKTTSVVSLVIPAKAEYLVFCRLVLVGLAQTRRIEPEILADLKLAVTEACSNAVRHAYERAGGMISIRFALADDSIEVEVEDHGRGFAPQIPLSLPLDAGPESGMGLAIIDALTDDLTIAIGTEGRGSLLTFRKHL
jgi:serine/threonine-protein kinase RsbW